MAKTEGSMPVIRIFDLLRDPAATAVLAGLAVLAPVLIAFAQRQTKKIAYHYENAPVLSVHEDMRGKVQVLFDGAEVADAHLVTVKIVNVGHAPILKGDFEGPLSLQFTPETSILSAEVIDAHPSDLSVRIAITRASDESRQRIDVQPLLLNRGDGFRVRCLVSGVAPKLHMAGRIAGVKQFDWFDLDTETIPHRFARAALWVAFGMGATTLGGVFAALPRIVGTILIAIVGLGLSAWLSFKLAAPFDPWRRFR